MDIEQQLKDFLLDNREYNKQFMKDLINIIKCHPATKIKSDLSFYNNAISYCLVTANFIIYIYKDNTIRSIRIIYKLRVFIHNVAIRYNTIDDSCREYLIKCFNNNSLYEFINHMIHRDNKSKHDLNIEWLLADDMTKSANN